MFAIVKDEKLKLEREKLELETKKRLAHSSTTELERFCRQEKGIDPNEGSVVEREVAELQHQASFHDLVQFCLR